MRRRAGARNSVLLGALALGLLGGCGGGDGAAPTTATAPTATSPTVPTAPTTLGTTTATTPDDPGVDAITVFVAAAKSGDAQQMWELLSPATQARYGPLAKFRSGVATELQEGVGSYDDVRVIVSDRITDEFGVVAIDGRKSVEGTRVREPYAVALRLVGEDWLVELGGPIVAEPIGPDPGAREQVVAQVAAAIRGQGGPATALLWIDGQVTFDPEVRGTATNVTMFANLDPPLPPGRHTAVVFAAGGRQATATAWHFFVAK